MKQQIDLNKKVEQALNSLDGIQRAEPSPFFYTRLIGRLSGSRRSAWELVSSLLSRPAVAIASLALILTLNGFLLFGATEETSMPAEKENAVNTVVTDNDYILASNSSFDYENLDQ